MTTTAADPAERLLRLLGLLQSRTHWTGPELRQRLGVSERTVRNDIERLRRLDYPVDAARGRGGAYRLGTGGKLPPLLLDDDEAVAVAVGLRQATGISGVAETSVRALAKLDAVLPHRLRRQVAALRDAVGAGPENTGTDAQDPLVDAGVLAALAGAIRDHDQVRIDYAAAGRSDAEAWPFLLEPYRLVSWQRRWYLVGRRVDPVAGERDWDVFRVDWLTLAAPGGRRFVPRPLTDADSRDGDFTSFVLRRVAYTGWAVHVRISVDAPADEVLARINPTVGVVEAVDDTHSILVTGADSVGTVAAYIGMLGLDFHVDGPPELLDALSLLADRYRRALPPGYQAP